MKNAATAAADGVHDDQNEHTESTPSAAGAEARARRMGWIPESDWDDDRMERRPRKFLSADEYIEKVEGDLPILRERNRFLDQTVSKLEQKLDATTNELRTNNDRVAELGELVEQLHKHNTEVGKRAYDQAVRELKTVQRRAVSEADEETFAAAEQRLQEMERYKPAEAEPKKKEKAKEPAEDTGDKSKEPSPAAIAWVKSNQKIWNDRAMNATAVAIHQDNIMRGLTEEQSLAKLTDQVREEFPHKFANSKREDPPAVSNSSPPKRDNKKETFDGLPADAKDTYDRLKKYFKSKGKDYKPEDYAKAYYLNLKEQRA